ncbi:hypothetical protein [Pseudodesulfovibrio indicus]|uniref:hypothetical protein n=1 Tax=Pseudodesulfovibrio indicus TaxID=1716143 RepID=UPI0029318329|nr:hypothetical protein [Pseudodesulfovibrio indicus]
MSHDLNQLHHLVELSMRSTHTATLVLAGLFYVLNDKGVLSKEEFESVIDIAANSAGENPSDGALKQEIRGFGRDVGGLLK